MADIFKSWTRLLEFFMKSNNEIGRGNWDNYTNALLNKSNNLYSLDNLRVIFHRALMQFFHNNDNNKMRKKNIYNWPQFNWYDSLDGRADITTRCATVNTITCYIGYHISHCPPLSHHLTPGHCNIRVLLAG